MKKIINNMNNSIEEKINASPKKIIKRPLIMSYGHIYTLHLQLTFLEGPNVPAYHLLFLKMIYLYKLQILIPKLIINVPAININPDKIELKEIR